MAASVTHQNADAGAAGDIPFGVVSSIRHDDPGTWLGTAFLTFDIDWAHDDVVADTIDLVRAAGVAATWFITHDSPQVGRLLADDSQEVGIHPNFEFLLNGDSRNGDSVESVVRNLMAVAPDARSIRSHSLVQGTRILDVVQRVGLSHDVNHLIPSGAGISVRPWMHWNGLVRVPYTWEDDVYCIYQDSPHPEREPREMAGSIDTGLMVVDFHPIHVFLNTESLSRYERTRGLHGRPDELIEHRFDGYGTRSRLLDLLAMANGR